MTTAATAAPTDHQKAQIKHPSTQLAGSKLDADLECASGAGQIQAAV
jgi:hypothetical protein